MPSSLINVRLPVARSRKLVLHLKLFQRDNTGLVTSGGQKVTNQYLSADYSYVPEVTINQAKIPETSKGKLYFKIFHIN